MAEPGQESFKPRDVEELIDWHFHRPLAAQLVRLLVPTSITPNQVTLAALLVGAACGFFIWAGATARGLIPVGAALLFASIILDCADGQLARVRGTASMLGRALDGVADYFPTLSAFYGQAFFLDAVYDLHLAGWAFGYFAGASMSWHCFLYDGVKNGYLRNTKPPVPGASLGWVTVEQAQAELDLYRSQRRWIAWFAMYLFRENTRLQLKQLSHGRVDPEPMTADAAEREIYREELRLSMRLWTFVGLGTHLFVLVNFTLLTMVWASAPFVAWAIIAGPMNVLAVWLLVTDPGRQRRAEERIAAHRAARRSEVSAA